MRVTAGPGVRDRPGRVVSVQLWLRADGLVTWRALMPLTQLEAHFGDRVVRCFVDRPRNVNALFAEALTRNETARRWCAAINV